MLTIYKYNLDEFYILYDQLLNRFKDEFNSLSKKYPTSIGAVHGFNNYNYKFGFPASKFKFHWYDIKSRNQTSNKYLGFFVRLKWIKEVSPGNYQFNKAC